MRSFGVGHAVKCISDLTNYLQKRNSKNSEERRRGEEKREEKRRGEHLYLKTENDKKGSKCYTLDQINMKWFRQIIVFYNTRPFKNLFFIVCNMYLATGCVCVEHMKCKH